MSLKTIISFAIRAAAALILLQTLYFKFTGHPESVELFTKLGAEPYGRIGIGTLELIASILLLIPSTIFIGALLSLGLMSGAILSHLTVLGIESKGDGGELFMLAIIVWICSAVIIVLNKHQGFALLKKFTKGKMNFSPSL
jgi:putative oxidoreductase